MHSLSMHVFLFTSNDDVKPFVPPFPFLARGIIVVHAQQSLVVCFSSHPHPRPQTSTHKRLDQAGLSARPFDPIMR